jgi:hypothetical protein
MVRPFLSLIRAVRSAVADETPLDNSQLCIRLMLC